MLKFLSIRVLEHPLFDKYRDNHLNKPILSTTIQSESRRHCLRMYINCYNLKFQYSLTILISIFFGLKEIITNLVLFLLTGFETTSSALSYCIYEMTQRKSEMLKLQAEVDSFFPPDCEVQPIL